MCSRRQCIGIAMLALCTLFPSLAVGHGYGSRGGSLSGLTTNTVPKATSATQIGDSLLTDDGTTLVYSGAGGFSAGGASAGIIDGLEGTGQGASAAGHFRLIGDSASHRVKISTNGGAYATLPTISSTDSLTNKTVDAGTATTTHAAGANILQLMRHATDCTAITDGSDGEVCYEKDANAAYICEPTAGGCDTAGEWISFGGGSGGYATIHNLSTSTSIPASTSGALTQRTVLNVGPGLVAIDDSTNTRTEVRLPQMRDLPGASGVAGGYHMYEGFYNTPISVSGNYDGDVATYLLYNVNGTGTLAYAAPSVATLGAWELASGATSGNDSIYRALGKYITHGIFPALSATSFTYETRFKLSNTSTSYYAVGLLQEGDTAMTAGEAAWCDTTNGATWVCHTQYYSGGFQTTDATTSPAQTPDTSYHVVRLVGTSTSVAFYFDGTLVATLSTNLPTTTLTPAWEAKTSTSASRTITVDGWTFVQ